MRRANVMTSSKGRITYCVLMPEMGQVTFRTLSAGVGRSLLKFHRLKRLESTRIHRPPTER